MMGFKHFKRALNCFNKTPPNSCDGVIFRIVVTPLNNFYLIRKIKKILTFIYVMHIITHR